MNKLRLVFIVVIGALFLVIIRLFYIQIFAADKFSSNAYLKTQRIEPTRGVIYDHNYQPLVFNQTTYLLYAEPKYMHEDEEEYVYKLDKVLSLGSATLEAKFDSKKLWLPIHSGITSEQKKKIEKLKLTGLGFRDEERRFYPEASTAAHLLGFVGKDTDGDNIGYFGIEGYYNKDLQGLPGILKTERDVFGKPIIIGTQDKLKGENGRDLILTIDKTAQLLSKQALIRGIDRYDAQSGCIIIMDPSIGAILGLTCLPDFDPTEYQDFSEEFFKNPIVSSIFEPGSILKPLFVAAALNEKKIKPSDTYNETGPIKIGKYYIRTWDDKYHGELTITQILENSSNVGMVHVGRKLGKDNTISYLHKYGFSEPTGVDLQGEITGQLKPKSAWYDVDYATVAFGQGIAVTPIQMITAFSSLVNGGKLMRPFVVAKMRSEDGDSKDIEPVMVRKVLSEKTSNTIKAMLERTVKHGEAKWDVPKGYAIGGKTGTAQIPIEGTYDASRTNASFIGFAPADSPKFIALVMLHQPKTSPWASETAAPLFFELASDLLVYYNIAPE